RGLDKFVIVVEDTGVGIPHEEQERIFEKFRQGRNSPGMSDTLTRQYEGTGLGLSIVRELSKLLGGDVHLVSEFGKGSIFTVLLPVRLDNPPIESPSSMRMRVTATSGNGEHHAPALTAAQK
ncbi:MAG TPA: ATP-binding protein, partial [Planctomycetaceae bacterium]|nr:ATP-binding protein [Planctomycetaceae bacterium]